MHVTGTLSFATNLLSGACWIVKCHQNWQVYLLQKDKNYSVSNCTTKKKE